MRTDTCEWTERISAFFDGEGSPIERWLCSAHARRCPACARWLEQVRAGWQHFREALLGPEDPAFVNAVMQGLPDPAPAPATDSPRRTTWSVFPLAVGGALAATIVGVLMPFLSSARQAQLKQSCQTNLRQMGRALTIYAQEHDDRLPLPGAWASVATQSTDAARVLRCPADVLSRPSSYSFAEPLGSRPLTSLKPFATPLVYEGTDGRFTRRHDGRGNVFQADGSVRAVDRLTTW